MDARRREAAEVALLLRVALGAVWVYQGLVPKLLAPSSGFLAPVPLGEAFSDNPIISLRMVGALEILLGLLLIRGWMVRWMAVLQCGLLALYTISLSIAAPQVLVHPLGVISKNVALFALGLCLVFPGSQDITRNASWRDGAVPVILRLGLGLLWLYEGIVPKWLFPPEAAIEVVAGTGLVPFRIPVFLKGLGVVEAGLGLTILAGLWVRGLATLQVGLVGAFTAIIGWTLPASLSDPLGGLSKNLGVIGGALALYQAGGGRLALDTWLAKNSTWRRLRLLICLQWNLWTEIGAVEIYRVQARAAKDPNLYGLIQKLGVDEGNHGEDLASLIRRHGGRPLGVGGLIRGLSWILGCLTVLFGTRISLLFDLWLEERGVRLYTQAISLLPPEEGISARALQAMQGQEEQHVRLLRDHLRAMRAAARRRR